jgi:hypothetical protein
MDKKSPMYKKALKKANEVYGPGSSIYRSSYIVKMYKEEGGKIKNKKSPKLGLSRWFKEEWVQVVPYLEKGVKIECGGRKDSLNLGKACRPLYLITKDTPITIDELLDIHSKKDIIKVAKQKEKNPEKRLYWKTLFIGE